MALSKERICCQIEPNPRRKRVAGVAILNQHAHCKKSIGFPYLTNNQKVICTVASENLHPLVNKNFEVEVLCVGITFQKSVTALFTWQAANGPELGLMNEIYTIFENGPDQHLEPYMFIEVWAIFPPVR